MKKFLKSTVGDVLLLSGSRLAVLEEISKEYAVVQFIDRLGVTYLYDNSTVEVERNLGQSNEVLASFYSARAGVEKTLE